MKIYNYKPGVSLDEKTAVALGFFDGVHAGHRQLLKTAREAAKKSNLLFTVFTFIAGSGIKENHPIYSNRQKLEILEELGVEAVIVADFSEISNISAEDFVKNCLFRDMGCRIAVAGFDFRYGKGRTGDADSLKKSLGLLGAECIIESEHSIDGEKISSTKIKELISLGNMEKAREFLGYPYQIACVVEHGRGAGKGLGFPTVNTKIDKNLSPIRCGVYRTAVEISGKLYTGVTNVGTCPTFEERKIHAETYIVDYSGDLYGQKIRIFFLGYLREERQFEDPQELIMQINVDKNTAIKENGELTWQEIGQN